MNFDSLAHGSSLVATYLRHLREDRRRKPNTVVGFAGDLRHLQRWLAGEIGRGPRNGAGADLLFVAVDRPALDRYLAYLAGQRYGSSTICRKACALRSFFAWMAEAGHVASNPTAELPHRNSWPREHCVVVSPGELNCLFLALDYGQFIDVRTAALLRLVLDTGMSRHEVEAITLDDLRDDCSRICVYRHGHRELPLSDPARLAMQAYVLRRSDPTVLTPERWLWADKDGERLSARTLNRSLGHLAVRAGVQSQVNIRALRNSHVAQRLAAGETPAAVAAALGRLDTGSSIAAQHGLKRSRAA